MKWQRVRISSDGGMVAGKLAIAKDASYLEKSSMDTAMLAATSENCITLFTCVRNQSAYRWCVRAVEV